MRVSKPFGQRTEVLSSSEPKKKYFLVYEGQETEKEYFDGIKSIQGELGIDVLLEINPLIRSYSEEGWSHPKKLLACLLEFLKQLRTEEYKVSLIATWAVDAWKDCDPDKNLGDADAYAFFLKWFETEMELMEEDIVPSIEDVAEKIFEHLQGDISLTEHASRIREYLNEQHVTYDPELDHVCMIVDRDRQSFKEQQYDEVGKACEENGIELYVSNPCFEFWLLLHFDEISGLDKSKLLENAKVGPKSSKIRYTESELRKLVPGYKKTSIKFDAFAGRIERAIQNEKNYSEDIASLKNTIGSNVGVLISSLKDYSAAK